MSSRKRNVAGESSEKVNTGEPVKQDFLLSVKPDGLTELAMRCISCGAHLTVAFAVNPSGNSNDAAQ